MLKYKMEIEIKKNILYFVCLVVLPWVFYLFLFFGGALGTAATTGLLY
jgi:hypothetical protein